MKKILILLLVFSSSIQASISPRTYNALNELQASILAASTKQEYSEVEVEIKTLASSLQGNDLGYALSLQLLAQLKTAQGDSPSALSALKTAYALKGLDKATKNQIASTLAYTYFSQEQYKNAIEILEQQILSQTGSAFASTFALLAVSYFSLDDYTSGLPHIEKACKLSQKPNESWLLNAFSANYKTGDLSRALYFTDQLVINFPEKGAYWIQKQGIHQALEQYESATITSMLSYKQNFLKEEGQLFNLGILMATSGAPFDVANILTDAIDKKQLESTEKIERLIMQAWLQAKEIKRARIALNSLFSEYQKSSDGVALLGYLIDSEDWQGGVEISAQLLKNKINLSRSQLGTVHMMRGVSLYRIGSISDAIISLGKASAIPNTSSQAKSWINYIKQMQG